MKRKMTITLMATLVAVLGLFGVAYAADMFPDVSDGNVHSDSIAWAHDAGVVVGYDDGNFGPRDTIKRDQAASMFHRYHEAFAPRDGARGPSGPAGANGADGEDGVAGLAYVDAKFDAEGAWTVSCPGDKVAIGGGYKVDNAQSSVSVSDDRPAGPWRAGDLPGGYRAVVDASPDSGGEVFAVCADVNAAPAS